MIGVLTLVPAVYGIVKGWRLPSRSMVDEPRADAELKLAAEQERNYGSDDVRGMWGMGVAGFILLALVVLVTAGLVKFVFFK
ncbi:hypothetical protein ACWTU6_17805 [Mesorhizobium sp. BHbsci]